MRSIEREQPKSLSNTPYEEAQGVDYGYLGDRGW